MTDLKDLTPQQAIHTIKGHGVSIYKIALMMQRKWEKVKRWDEGRSEPTYTEGCLLFQIHHAITTSANAPTAGVVALNVCNEGDMLPS